MNVEETARDFWATRPRRRTGDRKVAGVAAAIGRRYGIDPVLVRVGFVVATIYGGVGILLYLLGWLLLPADGDETSAAESLLGRGRSSVSTPLAVILGLALIPATGAVFGGDPRGVISLALFAGALFLLHRHRAGLGEIPVTPAPSAPADPSDPSAASASSFLPDAAAGAPMQADATTGTATPRPPAWDPLGAAPFAWDLPEPGPAPAPAPQPPPRRPRSRITPVTLGLALLAAGIASAFMPAISFAQVAAIALGVIGLGLVVGSLRHGGRGLIALAIPLALATWVLHAAPTLDAGAGERRWAAETPPQLQDRYELTAGSAHLDLSDLQVPDGRTVSTSVAVALGETKVFLPAELDVDVVCSAGVGNVACLGRQESGPSPRVQVSDDGPDGAGGGRLVLDVRSGTGDVEVIRRG